MELAAARRLCDCCSGSGLQCARYWTKQISGRGAGWGFRHGAADAEKMTVEDILDNLDLDSKKQGGYEPRRIKGDLTDKEVAYFIENKDEFPGVEIVEENIRYYDKDTVAVQTIGYLQEFKGVKSVDKYKKIDEQNKDQKDPGLKYTETERVGRDGLELMFQDELRGKNGYMSIPINPLNMIDGTPILVPPEKGNNVHTTIHKEIQQKTEQAIVDQLKWLQTVPFSGKTHPNAKTGYAVAMNTLDEKMILCGKLTQVIFGR